ncbi:MAG TPA: hypothetical protein VNI20_14275 [Fimbriimonadaceae bacterium]|nr:hypothetical protein [Fimbriimonadaceae bacterium]
MRTWPHAPPRCVTAPRTYCITAGTYQKFPFFRGNERIEILHDTLLETAEDFGWELLAWAVFANHYHLVGISPNVESPARTLCAKVHTLSAKALNRLDGTPGRKVWYRYWDTRITYEKSFVARMAYVHNNAVKHGLVERPDQYPWCSAAWFLREGHGPFVESVLSFKTDAVNVIDDF